MCKRSVELMDHLLLRYPTTYELWTVVCCLFGLHWVMPYRVLDMLVAWQGSFGKHKNIAFWRAAPHCIMWYLWREWNARSFEGCEWFIIEIKSFFLFSFFVLYRIGRF